MPLVLTQNEATESGHEYRDVLGVSYEYPNAYRNLIRTGERFIYYRGRRSASGPNRPQVYLGTGMVGRVGPSDRPGRLVCRVVDFAPFEAPLYFKEGDSYLEAGAADYGSKAGLYFRRGVREIDAGTYERILSLGGRTGDAVERGAPDADIPDYAPPGRAQEIDSVAMELAEEHMRQLRPESQVRQMPHNNPGFDLLVTNPDGTEIYVEVKGTANSWPHFFISEGQRQLSEARPESFVLLVCHSINPEERSGTIELWDGEVSSSRFALRPLKWRGTTLEHAHRIDSVDVPER